MGKFSSKLGLKRTDTLKDKSEKVYNVAERQEIGRRGIVWNTRMYFKGFSGKGEQK